MWNATGIWMWIMYIVFSLAVVIVSFSVGVDVARIEKSKGEKKVDFFLPINCLVWVGTVIPRIVV